MKKNWKLLALLFALLMLVSMAGCGSSAAEADWAAEETAEAPAEAQESLGVSGSTSVNSADMAMEESWFYDDEFEPAEEARSAEADLPDEPADTEGITGGADVNMSEKIIYSAYAEIETTEYDESIDTVYRLMDQYGAFLESSAVNGNNINPWGDSVRSASLVLRVPREHYSAITGALDSVGNVTYLTSNAENITSRYTDTESRLKAYETEEARLLEILGQAETVEDMITVESRLSEIRYEKEYLTSQLKNWDTEVAYSKVDLFIREVRELTPDPVPEPQTYWEQVGSGFVRTLKGLGEFFKDLFRVFVAALPVLIPLAAIVVVIVLLARRHSKKAAEARTKAAEIRARAEAEYAREHEKKDQ